MQSRSLELLVGFFVSLGIAAVFVLTFRVASLDSVGDSGSSYRITAKFENTGSLARGASVKMSGVRIGRVRDIGIDPETFQAVVTMEIDGARNNIPADSSLKILTAGLLGEQYIGVEPGGDPEPLKDGSEVTFTQSALVLENLIGQFLTSFTQKEPKAAQAAEPAAAAPSAPAP
ncbi:MAG: outer membrane lipid asymmetry maintenance protein MlaD [Gammaproteobacteria bacterium]|nr:outer membrane lipid asymmetry maintenance protein MlaD [Gammaproteobacteria bacterium]